MKIFHKQHGFTLVELLIVIVVIGLLAALTTISFNNVQVKTKATNELSDIKALNRAIQSYFSENSAYPSSSGSWVGWGQAPDFIPGLSPKYIVKQPQQIDTSNGSDNTYLYLSDGVNYKLISHKVTNTVPVCTAAVAISPSMADPVRNCWAFGIWSEGAVNW